MHAPAAETGDFAGSVQPWQRLSVGPENAAEHVRRAGAGSRLLVLLGSRAYAHPGGVEEGVRAAVEAVKA